MMKKITGILSALVLALALLPATVFAAEDVAKIDDGTTFETLEAAVKAVKEGGTVTLLKSTTGCGIGTFRAPKEGQIAAKSFTIDFGGFTYTVTDPAVGSTGTETQGFHLEWSGNGDANHNVTLKNGTIEAAKGTKNVMMLVQNYCNLTLENLTVDGRNLVNGWGTYTYVTSNNCGSTTISNSRIIANPGSVAFDVDGARKGYTAAKVIVKNSTVDGKIEKSENNDLVIMSGTFSQDVSAFMDPSVGTVEKVDGKYIVKRVVPAAAKIGDTEYETLAEAIAAAKAGDTVVLQKDVTIDAYQEIHTAITVDLGGNKLTSTGGGFDVYADLTVKNGSMETVKWAAWVQNGAKLVIEKDVTIKTTSTEGNKGGITVQGNGSSVTVFGKIEAAGGAAVSGIGNKDDGGVIINIEEGAVLKCDNGIGIYYPNTAELNIKGGTITGLTGVYVKSGKTTVTGGTIIGTGAKADYEYYGNGCNPTGDAFVVDKCNYPGGDPVVEIKGGTFKSEKANALASYTGNGAANALTGFVTGGFFSNDPSAFVSEGYTATKDAEGNYTVAKPTPGKPGAPMTYDAGIAIYGMSAVLSISGMAWLGLKKKGTDYVGKRMEK